ncbi:hypothetical protein WMY93_031720 [Mugilogobius chulae]|uniref:Uncharacterized protein n=1 Tax=Mugilogobius chulae TaxID=88201 RepID=A0AAW0MM33_9GOBI
MLSRFLIGRFHSKLCDVTAFDCSTPEPQRNSQFSGDTTRTRKEYEKRQRRSEMRSAQSGTGRGHAREPVASSDQRRNAEESKSEGALASQGSATEQEKKRIKEEIEEIHRKLLEQINSAVIDTHGGSLEKEMAQLRSQKTDLLKLRQCLQSKLEQSEALKAEKVRLSEQKDAVLAECMELSDKIVQIDAEMEVNRKLEVEIDSEKRYIDTERENRQILEEMNKTRKELRTKLSNADDVDILEATNEILREHNVNLRKEFQELTSKLPEIDLDQRIDELEAENRAMLEDNNSISDACKELRTKLSQFEACQILEANNKTLREKNVNLQEEFELLQSKLPEMSFEERSIELKTENCKISNQIKSTSDACEELRMKLNTSSRLGKSVKHWKLKTRHCVIKTSI